MSSPASPSPQQGLGELLYTSQSPADSGAPPHYDTHLDNLLGEIFPSQEEASGDGSPRPLRHLSNLTEYIMAQMDAITDDSAPASGIRIGPKTVQLDKRRTNGRVSYEANQNRVSARSPFASVLANTCVASGRWAYEVTLHSAGVCQIGWATLDCHFTARTGVGDSPDSFAFDGKRVKKWNAGAADYGEPWTSGDVISCCIDLDAGEISFYRNGLALDVAFDNVRVGQGLAYFPAASLSLNENITFNFGEKPFRYPLDGFQPLQAPPKAKVLRAEYLLDSLERAVKALKQQSTSESPLFREKRPVILMLAIASAVRPLVTMLRQEYIIVGCFIRRIFKLATESERSLRDFVSSALLCMEDDARQRLVVSVMSTIADRVASTLPAQGADAVLGMAVKLLKVPRFRDAWYSAPSTMQDLKSMFSIKLATAADSRRLLPRLWCEGVLDDKNRKAFFDAREELDEAVARIHNSHVELLRTLIDDDRAAAARPSVGSASRPYSLVTGFLRSIIEGIDSRRRLGLRAPMPLGLASSVFFAYLELLHSGCSRFEGFGDTESSQCAWLAKHFPFDALACGTVPDFVHSAIGGMLRVIGQEIEQEIPESEQRTLRKDFRLGEEGNIFVQLVKLASSTLPQHVKQLAEVSADVQTSVAAFHRGKALLESVKHHEEARKYAQEAQNTYKDGVNSSLRKGVVRASMLFCRPRRVVAVQWLRLLNMIVEDVGSSLYIKFLPSELFSSAFIIAKGLLQLPQHYEAHLKPFLVDDPVARPVFLQHCRLMLPLVGDKRIALPNVSEELLGHARSLLLSSHVKDALGDVPDTIRTFLQTVMRFYIEDERLWVISTEILVNFWRARGFCHKASSFLEQRINHQDVYLGQRPAMAFVHSFSEIAREDTKLASKFLNMILNHLNWAVSEFESAVSELQGLRGSLGRTPQQHEKYQRCTLLHSIAASLARLIEAVVVDAEAIFQDKTLGETNVIRVVEIVAHLMHRTTSQTHGEAIDEELLTDSDTRLLLLCPLVGAIIALREREKSDAEKSLSLDFLVNNPEFSMEHLQYLLDDDKGLPHLQAVEAADISRLRNFVADVEAARAAASAKMDVDTGLNDTEDDNLCVICCSAPMSTTMKPCGHRTCGRCITRHLQNSDRCFFCNAAVERLEFDDGTSREVESRESANTASE